MFNQTKPIQFVKLNTGY